MFSRQPKIAGFFFVACSLLLLVSQAGAARDQRRYVRPAGTSVPSQQEKMTPLCEAVEAYTLNRVKHYLREEGMEINAACGRRYPKCLETSLSLAWQVGGNGTVFQLLQAHNASYALGDLFFPGGKPEAFSFIRGNVLTVVPSRTHYPKGWWFVIREEIDNLPQARYEDIFAPPTGAAFRNATTFDFSKYTAEEQLGILLYAMTIHNGVVVDAIDLKFVMRSITVQRQYALLLGALTLQHYALAEYALMYFKEIDYQSVSNSTLLHVMAITCNVQGVRLLLQRNASLVMINEEGATPLLEACAAGTFENVKMLVRAGAAIDVEEGREGKSCAHLAAEGGHYIVINFLLNEGLPVDVLDAYGRSPLFLSASAGHAKATRLLLKWGASANRKTPGGLTPLLEPAMNGYYHIIEAALPFCPEPNQGQYAIDTPLIRAVLASSHSPTYRHYLTIKLLAEAGATSVVDLGFLESNGLDGFTSHHNLCRDYRDRCGTGETFKAPISRIIANTSYPELKQLLATHERRPFTELACFHFQYCYCWNHSFACLLAWFCLCLVIYSVLRVYLWLRGVLALTFYRKIFLVGLDCGLFLMGCGYLFSEARGDARYVVSARTLQGGEWYLVYVYLFCFVAYEFYAWFCRCVKSSLTLLDGIWSKHVTKEFSPGSNLVTLHFPATMPLINVDAAYRDAGLSFLAETVRPAVQAALVRKGMHVITRGSTLQIPLTWRNKIVLVFRYGIFYFFKWRLVADAQLVQRLEAQYRAKYRAHDDAQAAAAASREAAEARRAEEAEARAAEEAERKRKEEEEEARQSALARENHVASKRKGKSKYLRLREGSNGAGGEHEEEAGD